MNNCSNCTFTKTRMLVKSIFANTGCAFAGLLLLEKPYQ